MKKEKKKKNTLYCIVIWALHDQEKLCWLLFSRKIAFVPVPKLPGHIQNQEMLLSQI